MTNAAEKLPEWSEIIELNLTIRDRVDVFANPQDDPESYLARVDAKLCFDGIEVGRLRGSLIRADHLVNDRASILQNLDDVTQDLGEIAGLLFNHGGYREDVMDEHEPDGHVVLYLEHMVIQRAFRGHGFGLAIIQHTIRHCPHALVIMKPHPLQHGSERHDAASQFPEFKNVSLKEGRAKLASYYERLGFERLRKSKFWVRSDTRIHDWISCNVDDETLLRLREAAAQIKPTPDDLA